MDEFQDTAINQYELIHALTRGWGQHNAANPAAPRTVMIVGDGMQSIWRLSRCQRRAVPEGAAGRVQRVGWSTCNCTVIFARTQGWWTGSTPALQPRSRRRMTSTAGGWPHTPATAVRRADTAPAVEAHAFQGDDALAGEIAFVCQQIAAACTDPRNDSIAVLGRTWGHLQPVIAGLQQLAVPIAPRPWTTWRAHPGRRPDEPLPGVGQRRRPVCLDGAAARTLVRHVPGRPAPDRSLGDAPAFTPVWTALRDDPAPDPQRRRPGQVAGLVSVMRRSRDQRDRGCAPGWSRHGSTWRAGNRCRCRCAG